MADESKFDKQMMIDYLARATDEQLLAILMPLDPDTEDAARYFMMCHGVSPKRLEFLCMMLRVRRGGSIEHPIDRYIRLMKMKGEA